MTSAMIDPCRGERFGESEGPPNIDAAAHRRGPLEADGTHRGEGCCPEHAGPCSSTGVRDVEHGDGAVHNREREVYRGRRASAARR